MNWTLNNVTAPDNYSPASTLDNLPPCAINFQVLNQGIYMQIRQVSSPSQLYTEGTWSEETLVLPSSGPIYREQVRGVRFRASIPAAQLTAGALQAQVTVEAYA